MKISNDTLIKSGLASTLIGFAILTRFMPLPENFTSIAAIAIFGGAILPRNWAVFLPLAAMIVSDLVIGLHPLIFFTWGSFAMIALLSSRYLKNLKPVNIAAASIGASVLFFMVSNFGVWLEGRLYAQTFDGLVQCYYNALPFFRGTLLGDLFFSAILFGSYAFVYKAVLHGSGKLSIRSAGQVRAN